MNEQNIVFLYLNVPHDLHGDQSEHPLALVQHEILYPLKYKQKRLHQVKFKMLKCIIMNIIKIK